MTITTFCRRIVDGLWAAGGIGAAAELGLEDFGAHPAQAGWAPCALSHAGVRGTRRTAGGAKRAAPLQAEYCLCPVPRKSVRG